MLSTETLADSQDSAHGELRVSVSGENKINRIFQKNQLIRNLMPKTKRFFKTNLSPQKVDFRKSLRWKRKTLFVWRNMRSDKETDQYS